MQKGRVWQAIQDVVPILGWLPKYTAESAMGDLIAGITVGLTLIPQSIAYAALAGLEPQYGLYSSLCGGFIYACFGTVKDLNIAPTAIISLLTYSYTKDSTAPGAAFFLCFAVGLLQLLFGVFRLGFLVNFVSAPVVSGFTSAGAITIAASQVKSMLGLKFRAENFIDVIRNIIVHISETKFGDAGLSIVCFVLLLGLREIRRWGQAPAAPNADKKKVTIWFIFVGRNALIVITTSICAYFTHSGVFTLTNTVPDGLPQFALPFSSANIEEFMRTLYTGIIVVALVAILSNMAIAKAFSTGKVLNASQEMSTLGLCNIMGSFVGSFPVNASFSRAALNNASGARTTFGGIYTGIMVILSLTFLTKYFVFIPKAALASVIFCAVIYMIEVDMVKNLWKTSKIDLIPFFATLLWSLGDSLEHGILVGVVTDLLLIFWWMTRPKIEETIISNDNTNCVKIALNGSFVFMSGETLRQKVHHIIQNCYGVTVISAENHSNKHTKRFIIAFDCDKLQHIDYSASKTFSALITDLNENMQENQMMELFFIDVQESVKVKLEHIMGNSITSITKEKLNDIVNQGTREIPLVLNVETTPC